jgi:hypothetical protein
MTNEFKLVVSEPQIKVCLDHLSVNEKTDNKMGHNINNIWGYGLVSPGSKQIMLSLLYRE